MKTKYAGCVVNNNPSWALHGLVQGGCCPVHSCQPCQETLSLAVKMVEIARVGVLTAYYTTARATINAPHA